MRCILACLVALGFMAPAADAAPRPLMALGEREDVALAGDQVLFTYTRGRTVQVRALPLAGGPPRTLFSATPGRGKPDHVRLTASPQRAVLFVAYDNDPFDFGWAQSQIFAGTPTGDWSALTPLANREHLPMATDAYLEDGRVIAAEAIETDGFPASQLVTYDPARRVLKGVDEGDRLSGDLVLSMTGSSLPLGVHAVRLRVVNRRSGQIVSDIKVAGRGVVDRILRPDGSILYARPGGTIYELAPGGKRPRVLAEDGRFPALSGDRVVFARGDGLQVLEPNGEIRAFGIPTAEPGAPQADAANVLWRANGCVLVAAITDPPASDPGPGPCARTEFQLLAPKFRRGSTVSVKLRCLAAPAAGCDGTLGLEVDDRSGLRGAPPRVTLAPGATRTIRLELTHRAQRRIARGVAPDFSVTLADGREQAL